MRFPPLVDPNSINLTGIPIFDVAKESNTQVCGQQDTAKMLYAFYVVEADGDADRTFTIFPCFYGYTNYNRIIVYRTSGEFPLRRCSTTPGLPLLY